jgi:predicted outer membrane protein
MRWHLLAIAVGAIVMALIYFPMPTPLTSEQDILNKVKQAGLWEMPVGTELSLRGQAARVRDVGAKIAAEHHQLDQITEAAAAELGFTLTTDPTIDQKLWMAEIRNASIEDIDRIAINRLRAAHGKVLPLLAQVKVGTRDPIIRDFVTESMVYVSRHITYLESTGLVEFNALPEPDTVPTISFTSYLNYLGWTIVGVALIWWAYRKIYPATRPVAQHRRK